MSEDYVYDVFISYSSKDKKVVHELAQRLKDDGLRVWFDVWKLKSRNKTVKKIEAGLNASRVLVLAMSKDAFGSDWEMLEDLTFPFRDLTDKDRRFIPLRLDDAEIKGELKKFAYIDWRKNDESAYARLLTACSPLSVESDSALETKLRLHSKNVLKGHRAASPWVSITALGNVAVSGGYDNTVRIWDLESIKLVTTIEEEAQKVLGLAITPDGRLAVYISEDCYVRIVDLKSGKIVSIIKGDRHLGRPTRMAVSSDGNQAISGAEDSMVRVWDLKSGTLKSILEGHRNSVLGVAMSANGSRAISGSADKTILVWDLETYTCKASLRGHTDTVQGVAITADGRIAISGSFDRTLRVWDVEQAKLIATLEGHTNRIWGVTLTPDGRRAISGSFDTTLRVWDLGSGKLVALLEGHTGPVMSVAITDDGRCAVSGSLDGSVRIWDLPPITNDNDVNTDAVRYTNAKVLLVGDSGVGKTGLAYQLAENNFKPSISSDAVWATQLRIPHTVEKSGVEREIWLWDFAGQADYRLIHQLFMDETALAVLVFNPQNENPFEGLSQWDHDLLRAARRNFKKLLVAGRCDRGGLMISREIIERFRQERGYEEYIETSALLGTGCNALRDAIIGYIPWDDISWTASPIIFRLLKDEIVKLKDEGKVLLHTIELKQQIEMRLSENRFTLEQLRAVVGLLAGPGVVWQLEFGDYILLQPERINAYAAAVIRAVRAHTEEIGCIAEEDVLTGKLDYQDMKRLPMDEEQIVLRAMHQTFVSHGLCLREHTEQGTLLIFPSYFKRERPELEGHPLVLVTYQFRGALDEIYASLVVKLHHTTSFERDHLWRFAADFKTIAGRRLGLKMTKKAEGLAELEVYFEQGISDDVQVTFIRYVHEHLGLKAQDVRRLRNYVCQKCMTPVEGRKAIEVRLSKGFKEIFCSACGGEVLLWDLIEEKFASDELHQRIRELEKQINTSIDNESRELILVGHAYAIAGEAGQIYRQYTNSDHGIDGEIEFKDYEGKASGKRLYLQLKSGDSYLYERKEDGVEIFTIKNMRHAEYWTKQAYPVMLVIRTSDNNIRWIDVSKYLRHAIKESKKNKPTNKVIFEGSPFTALNLRKKRDEIIGPTRLQS